MCLRHEKGVCMSLAFFDTKTILSHTVERKSVVEKAIIIGRKWL